MASSSTLLHKLWAALPTIGLPWTPEEPIITAKRITSVENDSLHKYGALTGKSSRILQVATHRQQAMCYAVLSQSKTGFFTLANLAHHQSHLSHPHELKIYLRQQTFRTCHQGLGNQTVRGRQMAAVSLRVAASPLPQVRLGDLITGPTRLCSCE